MPWLWASMTEETVFNKGQKVVCIDDKFSLRVFGLFVAFPKEGMTYTIREVRSIDMPENEKLGLPPVEIRVLLQEIVNPKDTATGLERGFRAERFRPLEELDVTESLAEPEVVTANHILFTLAAS
jgi:hypothetical protein